MLDLTQIKNITHCYSPSIDYTQITDDTPSYDVVKYRDGKVVIYSTGGNQLIPNVPQDFRKAVKMGKELAARFA